LPTSHRHILKKAVSMAGARLRTARTRVVSSSMSTRDCTDPFGNFQFEETASEDSTKCNYGQFGAIEYILGYNRVCLTVEPCHRPFGGTLISKVLITDYILPAEPRWARPTQLITFGLSARW